VKLKATRHITRQASINARASVRYPILTVKQAARYQRRMKASISYSKKENGSHKLKSVSGYVSESGCEWDSNPCPHQPETYFDVPSSVFVPVS